MDFYYVNVSSRIYLFRLCQQFYSCRWRSALRSMTTFFTASPMVWISCSLNFETIAGRLISLVLGRASYTSLGVRSVFSEGTRGETIYLSPRIAKNGLTFARVEAPCVRGRTENSLSALGSSAGSSKRFLLESSY